MADDPPMYRKHLLSTDSAAAAGKQLSSIADYLKRFVDRLEALNVDHRDPLREKAEAARSAMVDLAFAVATSARKPKRSKWE